MEIKRNIKVGPHQKGVKDSDELPIRIRVTYNCNRVDLSTIFSVSQKNWDTNQQKVVSPKNHKNKFGQTDRYINDGIGARIGIINSIFKKYEVLNAVPTMDQLRAEYNELCSPNVQNDNKNTAETFFACYDEFTKETGRINNWTDATFKKFATLKRHLSDFRKNISFNTFNNDGLSDFIHFLRTNKDLRDITIKKQLGFLKQFLRWAFKKGHIENNSFETFTPKFKSVEKKIIYLTWAEQKKLIDFEVPDSKAYLKRVKDVFLFCCFTGMRYSDVRNLKEEDIKDDRIEFITIKTGDRLTVEFNKYSKQILDKYKDFHFKNRQSLPVISSQKMNDYLKELAQLAGIDEMVKEVYYRGNVRCETTSHKYELMSTHAARRTFICTALALGISPVVIMKWTGHSDYKSMKPYIDIADEVKSREMNRFNTLNDML